MFEPFSLFLLGMVYGATVCSLSCLPYFGPYLIATGTGFRDGVVASSLFGAGKVTMYSVLGGVAAMLGQTFTVTANHKMIMGGVLLAVACTMPFVANNGCLKRSQVAGKRISMFALGVVSSLVPCPPLAAIFVLAARQDDVFTGAMFGFLYGLGLLISPMLLIGGGFAMISRSIRQEVQGFAPYMQLVGMGIMAIIAVRVMW